MKNLDFDSILFYGLLFVFAISYMYLFPLGWLISDEYSYVNQAIAISQGETYLSFVDGITKEVVPYNFTPYSLGNSFWIAIWIKIFGIQKIYLGSLFAVFVGSWLLYKGIKRVSYFVPALGLIFLYPSLAFFGCSTMSSIPSFLVTCIFIFGLFSFRESRWKWFSLCLLASFSFWIRETNILLLGSICLIHFFEDRRWFGFYMTGTIIGFVPRLLTSYFFYGDPFYYLVAESFSLSNLSDNVSIYGLLILICMPAGLIFIAAYKGKYRWPIVISSFLFLLLYLSYSFNASRYSGYSKGIILMGRFLIPLLPFFVISVAWYLRNKRFSKIIIGLLFLFVSCSMLFMKSKVYEEGKLHKEISNYVYKNHGNDHVFFDLSRRTNIVRYLNPIHGQFRIQSDVEMLLDDLYLRKAFDQNNSLYIIQTINTANEKKSSLTQSVQVIVDKISSRYNLETVKELEINPGLTLRINKITN